MALSAVRSSMILYSKVGVFVEAAWPMARKATSARQTPAKNDFGWRPEGFIARFLSSLRRAAGRKGSWERGCFARQTPASAPGEVGARIRPIAPPAFASGVSLLESPGNGIR